MLDVSWALCTRKEMSDLASNMEAAEIERRLRFLADKCEADLEFNRFAGNELMKAISTTLRAGADYIGKVRKTIDADSTV